MSYNLSRPVSSNQKSINENLKNIVRRHLSHPFLKPISTHNIDCYKKTLTLINREKIIFDSGCGNGKSTQALAALHKDAFVIGIDKSDKRVSIGNNQNMPALLDNYCVVRSDLIDFLRLASNDGINLYKHYFLYPNPWPKKQHIQRRWHGSPIFPDIIKLGGQIEIRSNWKIYLEEFALALSIADHKSSLSKIITNGNNCLTDFEAKYQQSNHELWQLNSALRTHKE